MKILIVAISQVFLLCSLVTSSKITNLRACLESESSKNIAFVEKDPTSNLYHFLNFQWNSRLEEVQPLGYILPESHLDVQISVKCGKTFNIPMIPKSGGHSYEKYSFGNSSSVILDLRNLNTVKVDQLSRTADVGAGVLIGPLYWKLWSNGKFGFSGPHCVELGVAGYSLGGGYGNWAKRWGMMLDSILEMDFIDPHGDLYTVDKKNQPDLFWALRGAGAGNFGIVTKFKFQVFDASTLIFTRVRFTYKFDQYKAVCKAYMAYIYKTRVNSTYAELVLSPGTIDVNIIDADLTELNITQIRNSFPSVNSGSISMSKSNFIELAAKTAVPNPMRPDELGNVSHSSSQYSYRAKSYYSIHPLNEGDISIMEPMLTQIPNGIFIQFMSYGGAINMIRRNETSFVHRNSLYMIQVGVMEESASTRNWVQRLDTTVKLVLDNGESYQNYIDAELTGMDNLKRYYGENLQRLTEIKRHVDIDNYFSFPQSIPVV